MKIYQIKEMMGYMIQTDGGNVIAIDGGRERPEMLRDILEATGRRVNMWFMTHPHCDHFGSMVELLRESTDITVQGIWHSTINEPYAEDVDSAWYDFIRETKIPVHELTVGDTFYVDNVRIEVLGIANPELMTDPQHWGDRINNQSVVLRVSDGKFTVLFLADLAVKGGEKLLGHHRDGLPCDAVQMAHHGQKGVAREVYEATGAKYAFWPTPIWLWENRWPGTDTPNLEDLKTFEVRDWMAELKTVNITSFDGTVVFDTDTRETSIFRAYTFPVNAL